MGEGAATYGNPNDVLDEKPIKELMEKLRGSSDLTRSQPSSPAAPPQSSGPSQIGTQVLATQVVLPTKQSHQMKVGAKARAPTNNDLLSLLGKKPDIRQDSNLLKKPEPTPIKEIPSVQIPTVLSQVSDVEVSQLSSKIGAKANSRLIMNSDRVVSIAAGDKPPLVNSNSEKENSQEKLGRTNASTPNRTTNNSHRKAQTKEKKTSEGIVDRFSANPFEGMTKIPRKYVQIPKDQLAILERKDAWYEPPSTSGPLYAVVPVKVRGEFLAHLPSRGHVQERMASSDSEGSGPESDDEIENENEGASKSSGQKTPSPSIKVVEELDTRVVNSQEHMTSGDSRSPGPENVEIEPAPNSPKQTPSEAGTDSNWAASPSAHQKETLATLGRLPQPNVFQNDAFAPQSTSREATPVPQLPKALSPAVTPTVDPSTSRETTPIPQLDLLHKEAVAGRSTSREASPIVELPKSPPVVPQSVRRFPQVHFPSSSGIEPELELDELHAEGEEVEGENIKEADKDIAQVPDTSQEMPSTALRGLRQVQVEKSPFVDGSKSPQKNKLASSSDRRIPATFKLDSSKPEEFQDAMSVIPKSSSPGLFVTQNEEPGHNLAGIEDSDSEYASAEDNTFNQIPSSPFQIHAMRSSPPILSPSTPNRSQPAISVTPRGSMNGTPSREPMQGSSYAQVACTIPNSSGVLKSSQRSTARSNLQDLNISSSPPSIPQGGLATLDGASDHSPTNITPSKRRLAAVADAIRQEDSTRRDTKEMARDRRREFLLGLQAETPDIIPQTRPQPPDKLDSEYKAAPVEALVKEIVENSRQLSSPTHKQAPARKEPVAAVPQATPKIANETDSNHRPSKLLGRGEEDEVSVRMEEEDNTIDLTSSPSPPPQRMSGGWDYDPNKNISPWNGRPSKSFFKSPIGSPGSEKSGMPQTLRPPAMQNNVLVTQDYHQKFQAAYPEYHGSRNHFTWVLVYVQWLRDTRHALPKCLIDAFIAMMSSDFMQHVRESRDSGKEVMTGWDFFDELLDSSWTKRFDQGIIDNLPRALESLDQSLVATFRGQFKKPGALQTQPPAATPTTGNKPALPAPKSATKKADDLGATENYTPMEMTTKSEVPRSLPWQKNATQSATDTPTRKSLARHPSLVKSRQDTPSLLAVEIEEPNAVGSPDLGLDVDVDVRPKRKFESSGFVHADEHRGMREMPPAKRLSHQGVTSEPDFFITPAFKKPQNKPRSSFSPHPSFKTPSLALVANPPRSAKLPHAAVDDTRTPILQRNSSSPHPSAFKTSALAVKSPHAAMGDKIITPTVQKPQPKPRNSSSPHPSTFKTPSLTVLANSSRLAKSPHAVMNEKTKVEEWNYEPDDEDEELPQSSVSKSRGLMANLKRKSDLNIIQPSAKRKSVADDKVVSSDEAEELPPSASKSLSLWNELQRSKPMGSPRQEEVVRSETPQSNNVRLPNELKRKSSAKSIQTSANRHSKANDKVIPSETPQSTTSRPNKLERKSTSESVQRSAKRKSMTFKEFLPNSEFLRKRRESGSLSLSSRNSTPVGQRFETREEKGKGKKTREPETQGWFQ